MKILILLYYQKNYILKTKYIILKKILYIFNMI